MMLFPQKERLIASVKKAIELRSLRRENARLTEHFFSDTLFGHIKGAFTGAASIRSGYIEKGRKRKSLHG